jgi:hypothetical protein
MLMRLLILCFYFSVVSSPAIAVASSAQDAKMYWIAMANEYIYEHDRAYDEIIKGQSNQVKPESKEYLQGKFRFRMIASNFAIVGAGIQGDVLKDETIWSDLQKVIKVFAIEGTQFLEIVLPDQFDYSEMNYFPPINVDVLVSIGGAEMGESLLGAVTRYFSGDDAQLPLLVDLYLSCFQPVLGDDLPEVFEIRAKLMFQKARASIL